ncbi:hypothetical protein [Rhizobium fabae]|uniref:Lipoprotein n=1 Tax=Rhizobium fabae TaxID=573179 RepID=A0A7W6B7P8_9HYPH|nr:hypothetical protein [Rhizobium fabae]MBB3917213.1 hypothetical protein [Rhizobium fabae]RUM10309.1 hypothetical protein EFB14_24005 [Rhizobium fabae]
MAKFESFAAILLVAATVVGCGTVKEKTAPCKRPANLTSFADVPRQECGPMRRVNDPAAAFAAAGVMDQDHQ